MNTRIDKYDLVTPDELIEQVLQMDKCLTSDAYVKAKTEFLRLLDEYKSQTLQELLDEVEKMAIEKPPIDEDSFFQAGLQIGSIQTLITITTIIKRKMESLDAEGK